MISTDYITDSKKFKGFRQTHSLPRYFYCYNLCSLPASIYLPETVRAVLAIQYYEMYSIGVADRERVLLSECLPCSHAYVDKPFIYLMDSLSSVFREDAWFKNRDCCMDIIVDASGNIEEVTSFVANTTA